MLTEQIFKALIKKINSVHTHLKMNKVSAHSDNADDKLMFYNFASEQVMLTCVTHIIHELLW